MKKTIKKIFARRRSCGSSEISPDIARVNLQAIAGIGTDLNEISPVIKRKPVQVAGRISPPSSSVSSDEVIYDDPPSFDRSSSEAPSESRLVDAIATPMANRKKFLYLATKEQKGKYIGERLKFMADGLDPSGRSASFSDISPTKALIGFMKRTFTSADQFEDVDTMPQRQPGDGAEEKCVDDDFDLER